MVLSSISELLVAQKTETVKTGENRKKTRNRRREKTQRDTIKEHCRSEETQNQNRKIPKNKSTKIVGGPRPHKKFAPCRGFFDILHFISFKMHDFSVFFKSPDTTAPQISPPQLYF